jgi:hypothetical protein
MPIPTTAPRFQISLASSSPTPTLDEAIKKAGQALALHVEGMLADGKTIPEPTGLSPVLTDPAYRTDVLALVPLQLPDATDATSR